MRVQHLVLGVLLLVAAAPSKSSSKSQTDLGEKVVAFCKGHLGQQVSNGECGILAQEALHAAGAKLRGGKDSPGSGDYVWGELKLLVEGDSSEAKVSKGKASDLRPGDIIQFRDAKLVHKRSFFTAGHHTAVIESVEDGGMTVHVLQQNAFGKKTVASAVFHLGDLKKGWMRIYRPEAK